MQVPVDFAERPGDNPHMVEELIGAAEFDLEADMGVGLPDFADTVPDGCATEEEHEHKGPDAGVVATGIPAYDFLVYLNSVRAFQFMNSKCHIDG